MGLFLQGIMWLKMQGLMQLGNTAAFGGVNAVPVAGNNVGKN